MVYYNPHTTGYCNQIYTLNDQGVFHCSCEQTQLIFVHQNFSQNPGVVRSTILSTCQLSFGSDFVEKSRLVGSKFRCNENIQPDG